MNLIERVFGVHWFVLAEGARVKLEAEVLSLPNHPAQCDV